MAQPRPILTLTLLLAALPWAGGCQSDQANTSADAGWLSPVLPQSPSDTARELFDTQNPDARRRALADIASRSYGDAEPYLRAYRLLATDPDPTVRAAAAQALGMHGTPADGPLLVKMLDDDASFVRWSAALALQRIHTPAAVDPLIQRLRDDTDVDTRMAAAAALGQFARPAAFDALVGSLTDTNFGVVQAARDSLVTLTGHEAGYDGRDWLTWAGDHRANLFTDHTAYTYRPYPDPPGFFSRTFLFQHYTPPTPQTPVGLSPTDRG